MCLWLSATERIGKSESTERHLALCTCLAAGRRSLLHCTCSSTVSSYVDFVSGTRFRDGELVVLSVGRLSLISQVDSQLVLTSSSDLMQVGKT